MTIALAVLCLSSVTTLCWAYPDNESTINIDALAAQSSFNRITPFFEKHKLGFKNRTGLIYAASKLNKLFTDQSLDDVKIRRTINKLNSQVFRDGAVRIDEKIRDRKLIGKEYRCVTFNFVEDKKIIEALYLKDYDKLPHEKQAELRKELGIKDEEKHHLDCPGLEGVWFVNPAGAPVQTAPAAPTAEADRVIPVDMATGVDTIDLRLVPHECRKDVWDTGLYDIKGLKEIMKGIFEYKNVIFDEWRYKVSLFALTDREVNELITYLRSLKIKKGSYIYYQLLYNNGDLAEYVTDMRASGKVLKHLGAPAYQLCAELLPAIEELNRSIYVDGNPPQNYDHVFSSLQEEYRSQLKEIRRYGDKLGLAVHGVRDWKWRDMFGHSRDRDIDMPDGKIRFLNVLLEGKIRNFTMPFSFSKLKVNVGYLDTKHDTSFSDYGDAGTYGPCYIILNWNWTHDANGGIGEEYHKYYLVPNSETRKFLVSGIEKAAEAGLISKDKIEALKSKIVTYNEYVGILSGKNAVRGQGELSVVTAENKAIALSESDRIHDENLKPEYMSTIPDKTILCHIVTNSILPVQQRDMLKTLEQETRDEKYSEKVVSLSVKGSNSPEEFMRELERTKAREEAQYPDYRVRFDVACPSKDLVSKVQGLGMQALAFTKEGDGDIVQVEGIILALRALQTGSINNLLSVYKLLTGRELTAGTTDINELAKMMLFILPARKVDVNEIGTLNRIIEENIKTAA